MRRIARPTSLPLAAAFAAIATAAPALDILDSMFVVTLTLPDGQDVSFEHDEVPVQRGACYYWYIQFDDVTGRIKLQEDFRLPAETDFINAEGEVYARSDNIVTPINEFPDDEGWLGNGWCMDEGDPYGTHTLDILTGDELLRTFTFEAVPAEDFVIPDWVELPRTGK